MKTKVSLLLFTLLFISFTICNAQQRVSSISKEEATTSSNVEQSKASKGGFLISAGVNLANISGSDADMKVGASIALGYTSSIDGLFVSTYTANYTRGGYKMSYYGEDINANLDYIGWHMKCLFKTVGNLYLGVGFGLDYLVSSSYSYDGESMDLDGANICDMPIPISARYYIGKNKSVYLDASYSFGLFPVFGDGFLGDGCNRGFILSLGLKL